jgi:hypothetical protein
VIMSCWIMHLMALTESTYNREPATGCCALVLVMQPILHPARKVVDVPPAALV